MGTAKVITDLGVLTRNSIDEVRDGEVDTVVGFLRQLVEASRLEPANLEYAFYQCPEDRAKLVILERYEDESGFAVHRETEHFQRLGVGEIIPRLRMRKVETYVAPPVT
ncbi:putative quinol monooxygenase [Streptomyces sp. NPDC055078]